MGSLILARADWSDNGTVATDCADALPPANLQTIQPAEVWRSDADVELVISITLPAVKPLNFCALIGTNLTTAATWRVRFDESTPVPTDGSASYDSGEVLFCKSPTLWLRYTSAFDDTMTLRRAGYLIPSTVNKAFMESAYETSGAGGLEVRYGTITISDAGNPEGYIQAGRLVIGQAWQVGVQADYGSSLIESIDQSARVQTLGGQTILRRLEPKRAATLRLQLDEAEARLDLVDFLRSAAGRDVCAVLDTRGDAYDEQRLIYGTLGQRATVSVPEYDLFETVLEIEELV